MGMTYQMHTRLAAITPIMKPYPSQLSADANPS